MSSDVSALAGAPVDRFRAARASFFRYRREADVVHGVAMAAGFAALTGAAAQVRVPLPFTPVPVTLQTFAVLLAGVALGAEYGGLSQALYVGLGASGLPWFTGFGAGAAHLAGPTGGYLVGFVVAAGAVGWAIDRYPQARRGSALLAVLLVANFVLIYGVGLPWLYAWASVVQGAGMGLGELLAIGLLPFVPGDLAKVLAVAAVARLGTPPGPDGD